MSSSTRPPTNPNPNPNAPAPSANGSGADHSYFEEMRGELVREIAVALEQVLQNVNRLNRGLEGVIAVGNEFSSVEALWSQFEGVMGRDAEGEGEGNGKDGGREAEAGGGDEAVDGGEEDGDEEGEDDTIVR